jgi:hypothetical protein
VDFYSITARVFPVVFRMAGSGLETPPDSDGLAAAATGAAFYE